MRSIGLLLKKLFLFAVKLVLVAIPAVVASYCSYRCALHEAIVNEKAIVAVMDQMAGVLERQGRALEEMRGQVNVLKTLAASRQLSMSPAERLTVPLPQPNRNVGGPRILIQAVPVSTTTASAR